MIFNGFRTFVCCLDCLEEFAKRCKKESLGTVGSRLQFNVYCLCVVNIKYTLNVYHFYTVTAQKFEYKCEMYFFG